MAQPKSLKFEHIGENNPNWFQKGFILLTPLVRDVTNNIRKFVIGEPMATTKQQNERLTSHEISVAGVSMRLKTSHETQVLAEILDMVNKRIDPEVTKVSPQKALILACLRLAEDLYVFKQNTSQELNHIENLANRILSDLHISQQA